MPDLQTVADRIEIAALCAEYTDAAMCGDRDRLADLFTEDAGYRIPDAGLELVGLAAIREGTKHMGAAWQYFVQAPHAGVVRLDGDEATGRSYTQEFGVLKDGASMLNYGVFHDRYRRTEDGWKFAERVYEMAYLDTSALPGTPPPYELWRPISNPEAS